MTSPSTAPMLQAMAPIVGPRATVLILGSMPGVKSLAEQQYYAHPRNAFWSLVGTLGIAEREAPYQERCRALTERGLALWDVIATCRRAGSLDSAIRDAEPNDLASFSARHPELGLIIFNGRKAYDVFIRCQKRQDPRLTLPARVALAPLPSTSPANTRRDKTAPWLNLLRGALADDAPLAST